MLFIWVLMLVFCNFHGVIICVKGDKKSSEQQRFFGKKKKIQVSHPLTAIDGRVIARKGDKIDQSFLNLLREHRLPPAERGRKFRDTYHFFNFKVILDDEKYGRLAKLIESKEQVLNTVALCQ